ncbi:MAG TPA: efflux RND transporter periplasmic adaptor subunit [Puia sp.]|nr:efflux RND transporter periplasmic adaptor subunit [Puia sp.]
MRRKLILVMFIIAGIVSCTGKQTEATDENAKPGDVRTPVTVTNVSFETLYDSTELNATSAFLQNNYVKSTTTGYVKSVNVKPGEYVTEGKTLFSIVTKESLIIGNSISSLDSSFKFSGVNQIRSTSSGYVTQLNHQPGDYVQDGEQLAVISDMNSFVFLLNLPYELRPFVLNKKNVELFLPDGTRLRGYISSVMPTVDSVSQTQTVVIRTSSKTPIPQNLIAKVHIIKNEKSNAQVLPKSAILADETQNHFWVMKMLDSNTAVKVDIKKGLELKDRVEILEPSFSKGDLILVSGNYGLPDTAKVIIQKR